MFLRALNFIRRLRASSHIHYTNNHGLLVSSGKTELRLMKGAKILLGGRLLIGFDLNPRVPFAGTRQTVIRLGEDSSLEICGDVQIAPGVTIHVGKGAKLIFKGGNFISHGTIIQCAHLISLGRLTRVAWNCLLIDNDGHNPYRNDGRELRRRPRSLMLDDGVALQAHVVIPAGISVGQNSVVSANTVLRQDVPANAFAYQEAILKVKHGITSGLQFAQERSERN